MNIKRRIKSLIVLSLVVLSMSLIVPAIPVQALNENAAWSDAVSGSTFPGEGGASQESCGYRIYLLYGNESEYYKEAQRKYNQRDRNGMITSTPPAGLEHLKGSTLDINWNAYNLYGVVDVLWRDPGFNPYATQKYVVLRDNGVQAVHRSTIAGGVTVYHSFLPGMPRPFYHDGTTFQPNGEALRNWMLSINPTYGVENGIALIAKLFGAEALKEFNDPDNDMFISIEPIAWHSLSYEHGPSYGVKRGGQSIMMYGTFVQWMSMFEQNSLLQATYGEEEYPKEQYPDHGNFTEILDNDVLGSCMMLSHTQPELSVYSLSPGLSNFVTRAPDGRRMLSYVSVECPNDRASGLPTLSPDNNTLGWHLYYNKDMVVDNSTHTWDYEKEIEAEAPDPSKEDPGEYEKLPEEDKQYIIVKSYRLRNEDTGELTDRGTFIREETVGKIRIEDEELKEYSYKVKAWATSSGEINRLIKSSKWEEGIPREVGERGDGESTVVLFLDSWIS